jgi:hypothetical protein
MLDLASEQVAGATMEEVSTVLFYKVLQWAGYSRNLKVAALERRLKKEGRYNEFLDAFKEAAGGEDWNNYRNDELVVDSLIPEIAHKLYPTLFKTPTSFTTESSEIVVFENDRVREMLEIAREASGKEYIIFIIDEVGQYVGPRPNLILSLDGLAKNLKNIGDGKVWIVGTAQQTLTADDAKAALNSPELFKLNDRFPIQIALESNDIKEICYTRLLGKSSAAEVELGGLFDQYGQQLRQNTKPVDALLAWAIGVAPLWPLFRHKPWRTRRKDTWAKLEKGDYDWAHLAMASWPDRVREKCKTDKSLAIAHGLEDLYVEPEAKPKKAKGKKNSGDTL